MNRSRFAATALADLFPDKDYKLQMRFARGEPAVFFGPTENHAVLLAERERWLQTAPEAYSMLLPDGEPLLRECAALAKLWHKFDAVESNARRICLALGRFWEADFLLLKSADVDGITLVGGCLCFASHWRLTDKIGKPIEFIHAPVPALNECLGASIHRFLGGLKPGLAWQRANWGLSRSSELNQHPDRFLPRLDAGVGLSEVWLRVEEQALVALPESGGILFGIRIVNHPLAGLRSDAGLCANFCRALMTMPEALARYKNLYVARQRVVQLLQS